MPSTAPADPKIRTEAFSYQTLVADFVRTVFGFVGSLVTSARKGVKNLLIVAPMSAGKTQAAMDAMEAAGSAAIVAQGRALCEQHHRKLCERFHHTDVAIGTRDHSMSKELFESKSYRVLTIFKLLQLAIQITDLAEQCPLVILDEIDDMSPWYQLAVTLLRVLHPEVKIIAMTGTLHPDDVEPVKKWLNADLIQSEIRPFDLHYNVVRFKVVKGNQTAVLVNGKEVMRVDGVVSGPAPASEIINRIIRMERQTSVMYFSQRQFTARSVAEALLEAARKIEQPVGSLAAHASDIPDEDSFDLQLLRQSLPYRIGIHHGNVPSPQQRLVEELADHELSAVSACYTLARGTDFAFTDVVFTSIWDTEFGTWDPKLIRVSDVKQIAARCGRPDSGQAGHVWLPCFTDADELMAKMLIEAPASFMDRSLGSASQFASIVLALFYRNQNTARKLRGYLEKTLWGLTAQAGEIDQFLATAMNEIDDSGNKMIEKNGEDFKLLANGRYAARLGLHPMEYDIVESYAGGKIQFSDFVNLLSQVHTMFEGGDLESGHKLVIRHGLGVYRTKCSFRIRNFADYVERVLERCEAFMGLCDTPDGEIEDWKDRVYRPFICGESRIAHDLYLVVGRKKLLQVTRMAGAIMTVQPGKLKPGERKLIAGILFKGRSEPDPQELSGVATALGVELEEWKSIVSSVRKGVK